MLDYQRFKEINDCVAQGRQEEARRLLMELQSRCIALKDQMDSLKIQVRELEDMLFLAQTLCFDGRFYWIRIAGRNMGPFCPHCYNGDGGLVRLEQKTDELHCPYCGGRYPHLAAMLHADKSLPCPARRIPFTR